MSQISRVRFPPRPAPIDLDAVRAQMARTEPARALTHHDVLAEMREGVSPRSVGTIRGLIGAVIRDENIVGAGGRIRQLLTGDIDAVLATGDATSDQITQIYHTWTEALQAEISQGYVDEADYPSADAAGRHLAQVRQLYAQALWPVGILLMTPPDDRQGVALSAASTGWKRPLWDTVPLSHVLPSRWQEEGVRMSELVQASQFVRLTDGWEPDLEMKVWCELWDASVGSSSTRASLPSRAYLPTGAQRELLQWLSAPSCRYLWEIIGESVRQVLQETPGVITETSGTHRLVLAHINALVASPHGAEWASPSVVATLLKSPIRELREIGIQQIGQQRGSAEPPRSRR